MSPCSPNPPQQAGCHFCPRAWPAAFIFTTSGSHLRRVAREEREAAQRSDAVAFVSELDRSRAVNLLRPTCPTAVAPICLDLEYFAFQPEPANAGPAVLFSGHLAH